MAAPNHTCPEGTKAHRAPRHSPTDAIDHDQTSVNADGFFEVANGEYASVVNYCPWCGEPAPAIKERQKHPVNRTTELLEALNDIGALASASLTNICPVTGRVTHEITEDFESLANEVMRRVEVAREGSEDG